MVKKKFVLKQIPAKTSIYFPYRTFKMPLKSLRMFM